MSIFIASVLIVFDFLLVYIKWRLINFHPVIDLSDLLDIDKPQYLPEIEIPLYVTSWIAITLFSPIIYFFLKRVIDRFGVSDKDLRIDFFLRVVGVISLLLFYFLTIQKVARIDILLDFLFTGFFVLFIIFFFIPQSYFHKLARFVCALIDWLVVSMLTVVSARFIFLLLSSSKFNQQLVQFFGENGYLYLHNLPIFQLVATFIIIASFFMIWLKSPPGLSAFLQKREIRIAVDILVFLAIIFSVSVVVPAPFWFYDPQFHDYISIIGPVNDVLGGKTPLVDSISQYGVLSTYVLALIFKFIPLTENNFFWLNYTSTIAAYTLYYFILKKWLKDRSLAILGIYLVLTQNFFSQVTSPLVFGQISFLRFGWWIVILTFILFGNQIAIKPQFRKLLGLILIGMALFWGFDSGVYVLLSYLGYQLVATFLTEERSDQKLKKISVNVIQVTVTILLFFIGISLFTFLRSNHPPDWGRFMIASRMFLSGWGLVPVPLWGPIILFIGILGIAYIYILFKLISKAKVNEKNEPSFLILSYITAYAILQTIHYLGRSVAGNAHVIVLPIILVFCWLVYQLGNFFRNNSFGKYQLRYQAMIMGSMILMLISFSVFTAVSNINMLGEIANRRPLRPSFDDFTKDANVKIAIDDINDYLHDKKGSDRRIAIISMKDALFMTHTHSVNIVESNNMEYFITKSAIINLADQLIKSHPDVIFIDHSREWQNIILITEKIKPFYKQVKNIGVLDRWERI